MLAAASGTRQLLTHQSVLITALPDGSTLASADGSGPEDCVGVNVRDNG